MGQLVYHSAIGFIWSYEKKTQQFNSIQRLSVCQGQSLGCQGSQYYIIIWHVHFNLNIDRDQSLHVVDK